MSLSKSEVTRRMLNAGMPEKSIEELYDTYVSYDTVSDIKIVRDPNVYGTFAVRITRIETSARRYTLRRSEHKIDLCTFDLLWYGGYFDEVEFESWPPTANADALKFFV